MGLEFYGFHIGQQPVWLLTDMKSFFLVASLCTLQNAFLAACKIQQIIPMNLQCMSFLVFYI